MLRLMQRTRGGFTSRVCVLCLVCVLTFNTVGVTHVHAEALAFTMTAISTAIALIGAAPEVATFAVIVVLLIIMGIVVLQDIDEYIALAYWLADQAAAGAAWVEDAVPGGWAAVAASVVNGGVMMTTAVKAFLRAVPAHLPSSQTIPVMVEGATYPDIADVIGAKAVASLGLDKGYIAFCDGIHADWVYYVYKGDSYAPDVAGCGFSVATDGTKSWITFCASKFAPYSNSDFRGPWALAVYDAAAGVLLYNSGLFCFNGVTTGNTKTYSYDVDGESASITQSTTGRESHVKMDIPGATGTEWGNGVVAEYRSITADAAPADEESIPLDNIGTGIDQSALGDAVDAYETGCTITVDPTADLAGKDAAALKEDAAVAVAEPSLAQQIANDTTGMADDASDLIAPGIFSGTFAAIESLRGVRGEPPVIRLPMYDIYEATARRFVPGSTNPFAADPNPAIVDFGAFGSVAFGGVSLLEYARMLFGAGMVIQTFFYCWRKIVPAHTM